jgi:uncharacterized protein YecE (DUF72 family)
VRDGVYERVQRFQSGGSHSAQVRIGTSGWHYKHWLGTFYPEKTPASKMLAFYLTKFDTVELNNSFYRLPSKLSMNAWYDNTPPQFLFAVKGSRFLTHMKKLKDAKQGLERFMDVAEELKEKLGPILFQLPPNWEVNLDRLSEFLDILPGYHRYAFEFRNPTWDTPEIYNLLSARNIDYCIYDLAGYQSPLRVTANFSYVRLHGPGGKYQGSYSDAALSAWAERIKEWRRTLDSVYVYFDNDEAGFAAHDALRLKQYVNGTST